MADGSPIEWTDASWNPIAGCSIVSPGCTNCYAMRMARRITLMEEARTGTLNHYFGTTKVVNGKPVWTGEIGVAPDHILTAPLRWRRPRRIFVNSMSDLFHEDVPDDVIDRVFAIMALCPQHIFQVLTKRPGRMRDYMSRPDVARRIYSLVCDFALELRLNVILIADRAMEKFAPPGPRVLLGPWPLPNVWLGVSVEDQRRADERIPLLLDTPAAVRWISAEPLLGPIDLKRLCLVPKIAGSPRAGIHIDCLRGKYVESGMPYIGAWDIDGPYPVDAVPRRLDWVVVGGESGPDARPMHPDWARSLRDQCGKAGVGFFFKQWGEWAPHRHAAGGDLGADVRDDRVRWLPHSVGVEPDGTTKPGRYVVRVGKARAGRLLDGRTHDDLPEVRQ